MAYTLQPSLLSVGTANTSECFLMHRTALPKHELHLAGTLLTHGVQVIKRRLLLGGGHYPHRIININWVQVLIECWARKRRYNGRNQAQFYITHTYVHTQTSRKLEIPKAPALLPGSIQECMGYIGVPSAGHNLPDKSCVADTAMQIELA